MRRHELFFPEDLFNLYIFLSVLFQCNFWKSIWLSSLPTLWKFISLYIFASIHITYSMLSLCTGYRSLADRIEKKSNLVKREIFICQIRLPLRQHLLQRTPTFISAHTSYFSPEPPAVQEYVFILSIFFFFFTVNMNRVYDFYTQYVIVKHSV